jgi:flagellar biogenesis protein FliO
MSWLENLFGAELSMGANLALLFVVLTLALLLIFWLFRKIFGGTSTRYTKSRQPRLSFTDVAVFQDKRQLVLIRRDNVEHLVMIGGPTDIVVEQNIVRAAPVAMPATSTQQAAPLQYAPSPAVKEPAVEPRKEPETPTPPVNSPVQATLAAGGATLAGAGALAMTAKDTVGDKTSELASAASERVAEMTAPIIDKVEQTTSNLTATIRTEPELNETSSIGLAGSNSPEITKDAAAPGMETIQSDNAPSLDKPEDTETGSKTEDEMQRLLKELAAGN